MAPDFEAVEDGKPYVGIELANEPGRYVLMDTPDWLAWNARGLSTAFLLNRDGPTRHYVIHYDPDAPGASSYAARTMLRVRPGEIVKYRTANRADLRRRNLLTVKRKARRAAEPR